VNRTPRSLALAGTQFLQEGKLTVPWSEKNIREQAFVTEYIGGSPLPPAKRISGVAPNQKPVCGVWNKYT